MWPVYSKQALLITVSEDGIYYCKYAQATVFLKNPHVMHLLVSHRACVYQVLSSALVSSTQGRKGPSPTPADPSPLVLHSWRGPSRKDFTSLLAPSPQSPVPYLCLDQADPKPHSLKVLLQDVTLLSLPSFNDVERRVLLRLTKKEKGQRPIFLSACL